MIEREYIREGLLFEYPLTRVDGGSCDARCVFVVDAVLDGGFCECSPRAVFAVEDIMEYGEPYRPVVTLHVDEEKGEKRESRDTTDDGMRELLRGMSREGTGKMPSVEVVKDVESEDSGNPLRAAWPMEAAQPAAAPGRVYIGIDPGAQGYVCVDYGGRYGFLALKGLGWRELAEWLRGVRDGSGGRCACCMESIHAVYGSSAKATFSFGECFGALQGILSALGIPYHLVPPKTWQKEMWVSEDRVWAQKGGRRSVDNKGTSKRAAERLYPGVDFRRTGKCKTLDDNKCDAALICGYGRRKGI